jgi:protein-tyrosine phosphatase
MIDLHTHVLPGLDDGAPDEATALAMCRLAAEDGIRILVATPHFDAALGVVDPAVIARAAAHLQHRLAEERIELDLRFAAEVPLSEDAVRLYETGVWPAYDAGRRYVLLEVPPLRDGYRILRDMVFRLRLVGAVPVLAHPERLDMLADPESVEQLVRQGARLQITAGCLLSPPTPVQRRAVEWLRRGWVHAVSSDAHDLVRRPPRLSLARRWLTDAFGAALADCLTRENPARILAGQAI